MLIVHVVCPSETRFPAPIPFLKMLVMVLRQKSKRKRYDHVSLTLLCPTYIIDWYRTRRETLYITFFRKLNALRTGPLVMLATNTFGVIMETRRLSPWQSPWNIISPVRWYFALFRVSRLELHIATVALVNHLKQTFPLMFKLYTIFKLRSNDQLPSEEELNIAQGRKLLDPAKAKAWFNNLEAASENIRQAFERQTTASAVSNCYDFQCDISVQCYVGSLGSREDGAVNRWMDCRMRPAFRRSQQAWISGDANLCSSPITQPPHTSSRCYQTSHHVYGRGLYWRYQEDVCGKSVVAHLRFRDPNTMCFQEDVEGKISLSLDAWTSSNQYAFLAIVAHYINKSNELGTTTASYCDCGELWLTPFTEELLIDFRELIGEHSGENMADAVWQTLTTYGIEGRVRHSIFQFG